MCLRSTILEIMQTTEIQNTPQEAQLAALVHHEIRFGRKYAFTPEPFALTENSENKIIRLKAQKIIEESEKRNNQRHQNFCKRMKLQQL